MRTKYMLFLFLFLVFKCHITIGQVDSVILEMNAVDLDQYISEIYDSKDYQFDFKPIETTILARLKSHIPTFERTIMKSVELCYQNEYQTVYKGTRDIKILDERRLYKNTFDFVEQLLLLADEYGLLYIELQFKKSTILNGRSITRLKARGNFILTLNKIDSLYKNWDLRRQRIRIALARGYYRDNDLDNAEKYYRQAYRSPWLKRPHEEKQPFARAHIEAVRGLIKVLRDKKEKAKLERLFIIPAIKADVEPLLRESLEALEKED